MQPLETVRHRRMVQTVAVIALGVTTAYLVWRGAQTLNLSAWWLSLPMLLLEVHAAIGLALHTFSLWNVDAAEPAPPVEESPHRLAVFIPTYNEPVEVLLPTVAAAVALEPIHETWVLDDGDRPHVRELAQQLGARYLARPHHNDAKAGNLNYALAHVDADIVAVLDADHVAGRGFLTNTLGYFDDPKIALVQTPQEFYNSDSFEEVGGRRRSGFRTGGQRRRRSFREQQMFYRAIEPGKNRWDAAFWCGTGALLRTAALRSVGGIATGSVTEDIQTSIRMQRRGWRTVYHNEVLVRGLAAATVDQYALQRHRWCAGAMQVLRREGLFTRPGLTLQQRVAYAATLLGWFDAWRTLGYLLLPTAVIATGVSPIVAEWTVFVPVFVATIALQQVSLRLLGRGFSRNMPSVVFEFLRMTPTLIATTTLVRRSAPTFQVTPKGVTPKGRGEELRRRGRAPALLVALFAVSMASAAWYGAAFAGYAPVTYARPWVVHGAFFWLTVNAALLGAAITRARDPRFAGERRASYRFEVERPISVDGRAASLLDVSLTGARVEVPGPDTTLYRLDERDRCMVTLDLDDGPLRLECAIAMVDRCDGDRVRLGLSFAQQSPAERARLTLWAFGLQADTSSARPNAVNSVSQAAA